MQPASVKTPIDSNDISSIVGNMCTVRADCGSPSRLGISSSAVCDEFSGSSVMPMIFIGCMAGCLFLMFALMEK